MGRQRPLTQTARRKAALRAAPRVDRTPLAELDPCSCRNLCPVCDTRCMGGHADYPDYHYCFGPGMHGPSHSWQAARE